MESDAMESDFDYSLELPPSDDDRNLDNDLIEQPRETNVSNSRCVPPGFLPLKGPASFGDYSQEHCDEFGPVSMPYISSRSVDINAGPRTLRGPMDEEPSLNVPNVLDEMVTDSQDCLSTIDEADSDTPGNEQSNSNYQVEHKLYTVFNRRNIGIVTLGIIFSFIMASTTVSTSQRHCACENITTFEDITKHLPTENLDIPDQFASEERPQSSDKTTPPGSSAPVVTSTAEGASAPAPTLDAEVASAPAPTLDAEVASAPAPTLDAEVASAPTATLAKEVASAPAKQKDLKLNRRVEEEIKRSGRKVEKEVRRFLRRW